MTVVKPLTTHLSRVDDWWSDQARCGATTLTTSTRSLRMTHTLRGVDCAVCIDLAASDGDA